MKLSKINVMEGDWSDDHYYKTLLPLIQSADIPTIRQDVLPITRLYDDSYWGGLRSIHRIDIAILDPRHWYLDDNDFREYIREISRIKFPVIALFENPYGLDRPRLVDLDSFERKLFERTKIAVQMIRGRQGDGTQILSPAITVTNQECADRYLDYFVHHRNIFDIYALHLCNDMQEQTIGQVTGLLNHVLRLLPREVWVTQWAIPCTNDRISTGDIVGESVWKPLSYASASQRLRHTFVITESTTKRKSKWFFSGMCQDKYRNHHTPSPIDFWSAPGSHIPESRTYEWDFHHFLGMITQDGQLKSELFDTFMSLAKMQNEKYG